MKITESRNLKYDKFPWRGPVEGYEKFNPGKCLLEKFDPVDDKLVLYFKNNSQAIIRAINAEGGRELDLIEAKLNVFLEKAYQEILEADF